MNKIKAVLFDMDGVLIEAKDWHYEALNKALRLFGLEISKYDHLNSFDGLPTKRKLEMLSQDNYLPEQLHPFINELKQQFTMEYVVLKCKPMFHHEYALSKLHNQGYKIAVCSNSIRKTIVEMMQYAGLSDYIDVVLSNEDVKKSKPDPEIYCKAIKKFDLLPKECLVVEDNINGIKAGMASGAHVLRVNTVYDVNYTNIWNAIREWEEK
jgi:beta-phosphoglucomutase